MMDLLRLFSSVYANDSDHADQECYRVNLMGEIAIQ